MTTQSQYLVTVSVDGKPIGPFDAMSGGESSAEITKRNPAGGRTTLRAGRKVVGDITVTRDFELERDYQLLLDLEKRTGRAAVIVSKQPLDEDGVPWGKPRVWEGKLQSVNGGDVDSNSDDISTLELVIVASEVI